MNNKQKHKSRHKEKRRRSTTNTSVTLKQEYPSKDSRLTNREPEHVTETKPATNICFCLRSIVAWLLKRYLFPALIICFCVTVIGEVIIAESRQEIAQWFREMGVSTREGLHDLEVSSFIDEMKNDSLGAEITKNWRKTLIYKAFIIVGIVLVLGLYNILIRLIITRPDIRGPENSLLLLPLLIPFILSFLAYILKIITLLLGNILVFTAWLIPYFALILLTWFSHDIWHRTNELKNPQKNGVSNE